MLPVLNCEDRELVSIYEVVGGNPLALLVVLGQMPVSYTHLRAHETVLDLVCRLLLEKKKTIRNKAYMNE